MSEVTKPIFKDPETEELWWKLRTVVESRGEFGDPELEFGVIRKASFVFTKTKAELYITEQVDPSDLDGPLTYHMKRNDQRGDFELTVAQTASIGEQVVRVAMRDIQAYVGETEESMVRWQNGNKITPLLEVTSENDETTSRVSTQHLLSLYREYGLKRTEKKQLREQLKAEGYNDDEVVMIMRIESKSRHRM